MNLLFDQNLSRRLVGILAAEFPGAEHVDGAGLLGADDLTLWKYAGGRNPMIVSKDSDFRHLVSLHGPPPKVIWLRIGNGATTVVANVLRTHIADIQAFAVDPALGLLVLP